jgi:hypothetical protein
MSEKRLHVFDLEDADQRAVAFGAAMAMYCGEPCVECGHIFESIADLRKREVVFAGYHDAGRLACQACWPKHLQRDCATCQRLKAEQDARHP